MIKLDGYYIQSMNIQYDSRLKKNIYSTNAYKFYDDGTYKISTKIEFLEYLSDFSSNDFLSESVTRGKYEIKNDILILFKVNKFAQDIKVNIINSNEIYFNSINRKAIYVSFDKVKVLYGDKVPKERKIMNEIFELEN